MRLARRGSALALLLLTACSAFGPDDREHRFLLYLVADTQTVVDYEVEVFADNDGRKVRVSGLFRTQLSVVGRRQELNDIATSSPAFLGVKVEGVRIERLVVGSTGGTVVMLLYRDGELARRVELSGANASVQDVRVGRTF